MPRAARRAFPEVITLYLSELQAQRLRAFSAQSGRDLNSILRDAADGYLDARDAELRARIDAERKERDRAAKHRQRSAQPAASAPAAPYPPALFPTPPAPITTTTAAQSLTSPIPPEIMVLVDALPIDERPAAMALLTIAAARLPTADAERIWGGLSSLPTREQSLALLRLLVARFAGPHASVVIPDSVMTVVRALPADEQNDAMIMLQVAAASIPDRHPGFWSAIIQHPIDQASTRLRSALAEMRAMIATGSPPSAATGVK